MISSRSALFALVSSASILALTAPAAAQTVLFSTATTDGGAALASGKLSGPVKANGGITQIRMDDGGVISFIGDSSFTTDGADLRVITGTFTARAGTGTLRIVAPDGTIATLDPGNSASLGVVKGGLSGRPLAGNLAIATVTGSRRRFNLGDSFEANDGRVSAILTPGAQPVSAPVVRTEFDNPRLAAYAQDSRAELLAKALARRNGRSGFEFDEVSDATLNVNLAFLRAGGTPGQFSPALAGMTLQQYLAALRTGNTPSGAALADAYLAYFSADGLAELEAQQRALIQAYMAVLAAGGGPGSFNDIAIGTAYSDYVRRLAAGADGGLSAAALTAYENYIRSLGLGDRFDAGRRAQIEAYQRLRGLGGSPSTAVGFDIVTHYLDYLSAGGLAANYAGASGDLIRRYLDYLYAVGLPSGVDPDAVARLLAFYTHLLRGGDIGTLPPSTTPEPQPQVVTPPVLTASTFAGALVGRGGGVSFGGDAGGVSVQVDAAGYPRVLGNVTIGTARLADGAKGDGWVLGRYTDGTISRAVGGASGEVTLAQNDSLHFAYGTSYVPFAGNRGTATYQVAAFTTPTYADGSTVSAASLTGMIAIQFGTQLKYGLQGSLTTTAAGQAQRYEFASAGGLTTPSLTGSVVANGFYLFGQAAVTTNDPRCGGNCRFIPNMFGSGADGQVIAGTYSIGDTTSVLNGSAVFTPTARDTASVTPPVSLPVTGTGAPAGFVEFAGIGAFTELNGTSVQTQAVAGSDGKLESIRNNGRGTNIDHEYGGLGGAIGWTRWSGGTTTALVAGRTTGTIPENGGQHIVWGKQLTNAPTNGTATYSLAGSTKPTVNDGSITPGSLTAGSLAVDFGTMKVGYDMTVQFGGTSYGYQSRGGAAAPSLAITSGGRFTSSFRDSEGPLVTGNGCTGTNCYAETFGFLTGSGASHAGLTYHFLAGPSGSILNGAAVFARAP